MTIVTTRIITRLTTVMLALLVFAGSAAASASNWRLATHATVVSPLLSGRRLVWAEQVGTNGFRIFTARLGSRSRLVASIPNRRVRLGPDGNDWGYLELAAWPGGIAYAYDHEYCFEDCFGGADRAANPSSAAMQIVAVPFGRPPRVLWRKSCPPQPITRPEIAIAGRTLVTIHGSCGYYDAPAAVETSDLVGAHRRRLLGLTHAASLQASGRFISVERPTGPDTPPETVVTDMRTRKPVMSVALGYGPASLASDGALFCATQSSASAPWQVTWASPNADTHSLVSDVAASWPGLLPAGGRIAVVRRHPDPQPSSVDIFDRSGRRLAELANLRAGRFGTDVFGFDGHNLAWVVHGYTNRNRPETIVVRCVLGCR